MANRPRRSKPGARPETTIDLEAERIAKAGGAEGAEERGAEERSAEERVADAPAGASGTEGVVPDAARAAEARREDEILRESAASERAEKNDIATGGASADALQASETATSKRAAGTDTAAAAAAAVGVTGPASAATPDAATPEPVSASGSFAGDARSSEASPSDTPRSEASATGASDTDPGAATAADTSAADTSTAADPVFGAHAAKPADDATLASSSPSDASGEAPSDTAGAGEGGASAPAAEFARDEGFAGTARPRRDLGEFEDDETVLPAAQPEPAGPDPLTSSPYHAAAGTTQGEAHGPGFAPLLGAGLAGALIALGAGAALLYSGAMPMPAARVEPAQTQQFATAGEVQQVSGDLSTLRETVEQLQSAQAAGGAGSGNVPRSEFTQLTDRVAATERFVEANGDAANAAQQANDAATAARDTAATAETAANEARDTAGRAESAANSAQEAAQSAQQAAQNAQTAANGAQESVAGFGERLEAIEEANRRAAVALSAAGLKGAIDSGRPFMQELESFAAASGNGGETVASLRDFAASGVPTVSALGREWNEAERGILAALRPVDSTADVGTQVLSGLRSLVTVRPAGSDVAPDQPGPEAAVARMDAAIEAGDFSGWLNEWNGLPEEARSASQGFADKVRARADADDLIEETINSAVGASASQG